MILDAGCGNRNMWNPHSKENPDVIYIDLEKQLQRKPNIFASNVALPFRGGGILDIVFFDPPFIWNVPTHPFYSYPNNELLKKKYPEMKSIGSYYGIERYKTHSELVTYIYKASKELSRVLKDDGVLWVRWCTMSSMTEQHLLGILSEEWQLCLTHEIGSVKRHTGETRSFWFMLMKKHP